MKNLYSKFTHIKYVFKRHYFDNVEDTEMSKKYYWVIEVQVPNGSEGWQKVVKERMRHAIEKLRASVEELGGKVCVRY